MSHAHTEPENTYFLDQLCTVAIGGMLGLTAIGLYYKGWLQSKFGLIPRFHVPVLAGGIALLVMVLLRAAAIWRQAGQVRAARLAAATDNGEHPNDAASASCDHPEGHEHAAGAVAGHAHGHDHAHSHGHEHAHGDDEEGEAHDHGWAPWQYAVLIIPALLFFLGLPMDGYNMTRINRDLTEMQLETGGASKRQALASLAGGGVIPALRFTDKPLHLKFSELSSWSAQSQKREDVEGRTVILQGFYHKSPHSDTDFQLFRVMVNCCQTDAITLKARIIAPEPLQGLRDNFDWVEIEGELAFQKIAGRKEWIPVIRLASMDQIRKFAKAPDDPNKDV